MKDGNKVDCNITSIDESKVNYTSSADENLSVPLNRLLMLFYEDGSYKVIDQGQEENYLSFPANSTYDHLLTYDNKLELIIIESQTGESIKYSKPGSSDLTHSRDLFDLMMIVYKNGQHEIFGEYEEVAEALLTVSPQDREALVQASNSGGMESSSATDLTENETPPISLNESETPSTETSSNPEVDRTDGTSPGTSHDLAETFANEGILEVDLETYKSKALDKTENLALYFQMIADKETPWQDANKAIDLAVTLFINEDAKVEVSSVNSAVKKHYPIRVYLERLKLLKYDQVDIEWSDISYVSELRKGPDGNYYGTISFVQKFTGSRDGQVVYSDLTRKNIEVILKGYEKDVAGEIVQLWDIFLSDIGVVNTRKG
ncbi:MAG: hypothetical protein AAF587_07745 [Bacteroidota bacterium]